MKLLAISLLLLCGCGTLVPHENKNIAAATDSQKSAQTAQVSMLKEVTATPPMEVSSTGTGNVVNVTVEAPAAPLKTVFSNHVSTAVNTSSALKESDEFSIPLGVKLAMLAFGIVALIVGTVFAVRYLMSASAAAKAAFTLADNGIAQIISTIESKQATETNPATLLTLANLKSIAEKQRGKINAQ